MKKQVLDELSQSSSERYKEGEVKRLEDLLNREYSLYSRKIMEVKEIYERIYKQWFDVRGERLSFQDFMGLVSEANGFQIFKVDDIGEFLQRTE